MELLRFGNFLRTAPAAPISVLMDFDLPDINGHSIVLSLRRQSPPNVLPIIAVMVQADEESIKLVAHFLPAPSNGWRLHQRSTTLHPHIDSATICGRLCADYGLCLCAESPTIPLKTRKRSSCGSEKFL